LSDMDCFAVVFPLLGGKMENGKWKMENGKWKMENGKWKMENGKWKMEKKYSGGERYGE
jgi:hypothetical protein